jgi:hypothetical protein
LSTLLYKRGNGLLCRASNRKLCSKLYKQVKHIILCVIEMVRALCLEVIEEGKVVNRQCVDEDLLEEYIRRRQDDSTANWVILISSIFRNVNQNERYQPLVYDYNGFSHSINFKAPISGHFFNTSVGALRAYIAVGTDRSPTTHDTFRLWSPLAENPIESMFVDTQNRTVHLVASFTFSTTVTIYEVGLSIDVVNVNNQIVKILLDRTVISGGITVSPNQILRIIYRFAL